jgi:Zn-dependent peptidase ImmA (M78 family)
MLILDTCYSFSQVPYLTYDALDGYAEDVVRDFAPGYMRAAQPFDAELFAEYYLGLEVVYARISGDRQILGMTAFNTGVIQVANAQTGQPEPMPVRVGTVLIEPSLAKTRNLPRMRFTLMHEAAHWLLHRPAFAEDNPFGSPGVYENQYVAAKEGRIDYSRSQKERNDNERIERQADFLASALLMPRPPLRLVFREFFKYYDERPRQIVRGRDTIDDGFAALLPQFAAKKFGVSNRAALIRLEKLNAIVGKPLRTQ